MQKSKSPEGAALQGEKINTYPEMNEIVKDLLRWNGEPMNLYALARIEELEKMNAELLEAWKDVCEGCGFNDACESNNGCEFTVCGGHEWRSYWRKNHNHAPEERDKMYGDAKEAQRT